MDKNYFLNITLRVHCIKLNEHKQKFSLKEIIPTGDFKDGYLDYELKLKLEFIRIYFDATSFDKITKDRSDSAIDKLSAIGGTMGLLTGFSIISGVEILYFTIKIVLSSFKRFIGSSKKGRRPILHSKTM